MQHSDAVHPRDGSHDDPHLDALDHPDDDPRWDDVAPPRRRRRRRPGTRRDLSDLTGPHPDGRDQTDLDPAREGDLDHPTCAHSTWGDARHGPEPRPDWVVTALGARDVERGILKTGKEADVHLLERVDPSRDDRCLLAAKRYRTGEHRMFHRDAGYLEGRRVRKSRETRAMARRTEFGRELIGVQWALAEFEAMARLWTLTGLAPSPDPLHSSAERGARALVPYPVQLRGRELMMEFIGEDDGTAAPRLAQSRPDREHLVDLWHQALAALGTLALAGLAHGDLSAYNVLLHRGRLVLIDLPQVVDIVSNPRGPDYLARDVANLARWFLTRGLPSELCDVPGLVDQLAEDAGIRSPAR